MKVYLIGFMASGKTTVGIELAKTLHYEFIDLDAYIERKYNKTVKQIFEQKGEDHFRILENDALREVSAFEGDFIIAAGGGTSCFYNSIDFMNKTGLTIYLKAEVAELVARLIASKTDRPLLWGKTQQELNDYIIRVLDERKKYYEKAKITIESAGIDVRQLAQTILASIE
ncbi:MAG: shikimate kinase [Bacteroidales bacterium]|nr:MAG: shikimate kinase [Bacteroidales bacterium]